MFVSIIVPNYNHERFLQQRFDSIFAQTFTGYEVIILDDCSTDNSKAIIESFRHLPKVSAVIYNERNSGSPFQQWRKGLELTKGDWIWIAESDDFCAPDMLQTLVEHTLTDADTVLSYCQSNEIDEKGQGWRDMRWFTDGVDKEHWNNDYRVDGTKEIKNYLWRINSIPNASAVLFKKAAFANADRGFERMKMCGDWLLWIEILRQGKVSFCVEPLNFFRTHNATTRTHEKEKWRERLQEEYTVAKHLLTFLPLADHKKIRQRITGLLHSYCSTFSGREVVRFIGRPASYKTTFPLYAFLRLYFAHLIRKRVKSLLAFAVSLAFWRKRQFQRN